MTAIPITFIPAVQAIGERMKRDSQRLAWARLWAEGVYFYSQECAWKWLHLRRDLREYERQNDAQMVQAIGFEMDDVVREDEAKEEAAQIARILEEMENEYWGVTEL